MYHADTGHGKDAGRRPDLVARGEFAPGLVDVDDVANRVQPGYLTTINGD